MLSPVATVAPRGRGPGRAESEEEDKGSQEVNGVTTHLLHAIKQ